jgi:hypothetical protein
MPYLKKLIMSFSLLLVPLLLTSFVPGLLAAENSQEKVMTGAERPESLVKMMQEPNKVLANTSIQYLAAFTNALHLQAAQRPDQIDRGFINAAFGEIKRSFAMIEQFQKAHVKTMDAAIQSKVKMMMERMNRNLAGIKENLDLLEKEINQGNNPEGIALRTGEMLKYLEDLARMRAAQGGQMDQPLKKEMMK